MTDKTYAQTDSTRLMSRHFVAFYPHLQMCVQLKSKLVIFVLAITAYSLVSCAQHKEITAPALEQKDVAGPEYNTPPPRHQ